MPPKKSLGGVSSTGQKPQGPYHTDRSRTSRARLRTSTALVYGPMVAAQSMNIKPQARGVPFLFQLGRKGEPSTPYLYPLEEAQGVGLIEAAEPTSEKVRLSSARGGKKRPRIPKLIKTIVNCPLVVDTEFQTRNDDTADPFFKAVNDKCQEIERGSIPLTVQIGGITKEAPVRVYLHPDFLSAFPEASPIGPIHTKEPIAEYISELTGMETSFEILPSIEDPTYTAFSSRRVFRLHLYAHFALADFLRVWGDRRIVNHIRSLTHPEGDRGEAWIVQERRLRFSRTLPPRTKHESSQTTSWLPIPVLVKIGHKKFALEIGIFDNSAMVGDAGASLMGFHSCAGLRMAAKDNYEKKHKERMLLNFINGCDLEGFGRGAYASILPKGYNLGEDPAVLQVSGPQTFLDYAAGDVETLYEAIMGICDRFRQVYRSLGLEAYYEPPKPTTGSTVHSLLKAAVFRRFEGVFDDREFLNPEQRKLVQKIGLEPAEAQSLASSKSWAGMNAKVIGGRCTCTAPTISGLNNRPIADMDVGSCYPSAMALQEFPIGRPQIIGDAYYRNSKRNKYQTLRQFLKKYGNELVPSLWQAWISVEDDNGKPIPFPEGLVQDFFNSWDAPSSFFEHEVGEEGVWLERTDRVKIYLTEITNGLLQSDSLEWLEKVCSSKLRAFILDNARVKAAMFYPKSCRLRGAKEFVEAYAKYETTSQKNTSTVKVRRGSTRTENITREFDGWFSVNLADLISDDLKNRRKEFKQVTRVYKLLVSNKVRSKEDLDVLSEEDRETVEFIASKIGGGIDTLIEDSKVFKDHPMDKMYKLVANTIYGVVVSRFFVLSNPMVGNNITARVRTMIWYYEKACRAFNSITDGGLMALDNVLYSRNPDKWKINENNTTLTMSASKAELNRRGLYAAPIGGYDSIRWEGDYLIFEKGRKVEKFHKSEHTTYMPKVDALVLDHVRKSFPSGITLLAKNSPFTFEAKGVVQDVAIHGAGNYFLRGGHHGAYGGANQVVKMRSYSSDIHDAILAPFFEGLLKDPTRLDRTRYYQPFINRGILKPGAYSARWKSYYKDTYLEPGDNVYSVRIFRELGISAFRFHNRAQEKAWTDTHERERSISLPKTHGQSFEPYFANPDGTLNYQGMIEAVGTAIQHRRPTLSTLGRPPMAPHPKVTEAREIRLQLLRGPMLTPKGKSSKGFDGLDLDVEVQPLDYFEDIMRNEISEAAYF